MNVARHIGLTASAVALAPLSAALVIVLVVSAGCAGSDDFHVDTLDVKRLGWDSVRTSVTFIHDPVFGGPRPVQPDTVMAHIFSLDYDTLFAGRPGVLPVPDKRLGNEERVLVEVCGSYRSRTACEQYSLTASPKRSTASLDIGFPIEPGDIENGDYDLSYTIERQVFEREDWTPIELSAETPAYLEAYLENGESDHIRIPVQRHENEFRLSRFAHYRDFRFDVNSSLMDTDSATVIFDLFAALGPTPMQLASRRVVVRRKSEQERREEVGFLTELAAGQVLDRLKRFFGLRRAYVFINDWSYVALDRIYRVETELHWQDAFRGDWSDLTGELVIRSDGTLGTFRYLRGSESAERRWNSRIDSTLIRLEPVIDNVHPPTEDQEENVRRTRSPRR